MVYRIVSCGSNGNYQLGISNNQDQHTPTPVQFKLDGNTISTTAPCKPIKVSCGGNHTVILLSNGDIYTAGLNNRGQQGVKTDDTRETIAMFTKLETDFKFKDVVAGWEFSIFITINNKLFSFGFGGNGELGHGNRIIMSTNTNDWVVNEIQVINQTGIKKIKSSIHSTIIQFNDGELYGVGNNKKGQLLDLDEDKRLKLLWEPTKLSINSTSEGNYDDTNNNDIDNEKFKVLDFAMGRDFTVFLIVDGVGGRRFIFKGKDNFSIYEQLQKVDLNGLESIESMWSSIHLIYTHNNNKLIRSFGNNSHGQLVPELKPTEDNFVNYDIGSEHGLILTSQNKVFAWGWGEHGNCGINQNQKKSLNDEVTFDYFNEIYSGSDNVVGLFGGCATSWIVLQSTNY